MKKLFLILLIINCTLTFANAQWIFQHSNNNSYSFHHVAFLNNLTGWVCGDGVIKKTTNGGNNWIEQTHPATNKYLYCIFPIDSDLVYCVGYWQTILRTTNGGNNWYAIRNGNWGNGPSYLTTYFLNRETGWITGSGFTILKTTNGCQTFDSIVTIPMSFLYDIRFKDAMTGITCGVTGQVKKTTNSGYNWFSVNIPLNDTLPDFIKMSVLENQYCHLAGRDGRIFYSTDFGSNWIITSYIQRPLQQGLYCIKFANLFTGWTGGESGILYKTTDGGYNWKRESTKNDPTYNECIWFYDTLVGWVVGGGGKILHTTTGGTTYINNISLELPNECDLYQNYPNPFNPVTFIKYQISRLSSCDALARDLVYLKVYDILGKEVATLVNEKQSPGTYEVTFDGSNLSTGIYFYRIVAGNFISVKRMVLIK